MPYSVGSASVDIVPNARGFQAKLDAQLRDVKVAVEAVLDDKRLREQIAAAARGAQASVRVAVDESSSRSARAKIADVAKSRTANVRVDADTAAAKTQIADLRAQLRSENLNLRVSTAEAQASIAELRAKIAATKARLVVQADDKEAKAELDRLQGQLREMRAKVEADTAPAKVRVEALRAEIARTEADIRVGADTGAAETKLAALGSSAGGAGGSMMTLVAAAAAIAPAIVPAAAAASGALLGIGSGAIVGAAGIGVLVLGLSGVVSAVSAVVKAQDSSKASAAANAAAQVAAAQRVRSAQAGVQSAEASLTNARASAADAARRSAQAVQQAQEGVRAATQEAARGIAQAQQGVAQAAQGVTQALAQEASAERSLQSALQQETDAQKALSDARKQAKRDIEDLTNSVADGALAQRQAAIDVENARAALSKLGPTQLQIEQATARTALAQDRYAKLLTNPKATQAQRDAAQTAIDAAKAQQLALEQSVGGSELQRRQAQLNYDQAIQHQKELATSQQRLIQQQKTAQAAGVNGAPVVTAAQRNLAQAHQGVADAHQGVAQAQQGVADAHQNVADAQKAVVQARIDGTARIAKAEQSLADAEAARASQERQSQYAIAQAQQQVANSQRALQDAYAKTGTTAAGAGDKAKEALAKLTPEGRALAKFIVGTLIPGFKRLSDLAQSPIAAGALAGLRAAAPLVPVLTGLIGALADAMGRLLDSAGKALGSPFWLGFFGLLRDIAGPVIDNLGTILGNLAVGFAGMLEKFEPVGAAIGDALITLSARFRDFGTGRTNGLARFFDYVQQVGPLVAGMFGAVLRMVGHLFVAMAPFGTTVVGWITDFANWVSRIPVETLRRVATHVAAIVLAAKGLSLASGAFGAIGAAVTVLANPVGLIAVLIGSVVAVVGLVLAHSKAFRDFIVVELIPALAGAASWLWDHLRPAFHAIWVLISTYVVPTLIHLAREALAGARIGFHLVADAIRRNRPELEKIWAAFKKVYEFVWTKLVPLLGPILKATFIALGGYIAILIDVIGGIVDAFTWVHDKANALLGRKGSLRTIFSDGLAAIKGFIDGMFGKKGVIRQLFSDGVAAIHDIFNVLLGRKGSLRQLFADAFAAVNGAADALLGKKGSLRRIFSDGVAALGKIWDGLKALAKAPISFIINTVLNKGLIPAYNWVANVLPGIGPISPVSIKGFAGGTSNVLPGYTPGRDVHRFYSPTAGMLDLSGGEGIARPELVQAVGPARWDAANAAAAAGRTGDGLRYLGGFAQGASRVWPTNTHALSGNYAGHSGVDIAAGMGAPIYAAAPGTITYTGWGHGYGQAIFEKMLGSALSIVYGHTSKLIAHAGQHVNAGQLIGLVGATGHATGPHLHFEINSPGPFGNSADRANSLAWLNGATVNGGGGTVGGGPLSGLIDWVARLKDRIAGPLDKLRGLGSSPWAKLVGAVPKALASSMVGSVKNVAGNLLSSAGDAIVTGSNRARGLALLTAAGFNPLTQWGSLNKLWTRESGWRTTATNPSSGAYGIPQSLPASKMASAGPDWRTNPNTQIKWGLQYIKDVYGSPANAWAHEISRGWYDNGGWLQPGTTLVHNNTGRPEPVLNPAQWESVDRLSRGGGTKSLTAAGDVYVGYDPGEIFDEWDRRDRRAAVRHNLIPV